MDNDDLILDNFHAWLNSCSKLLHADWENLQRSLQVIRVPRRHYLLKTGRQCQAAYFIHKGYCRCVYNRGGKEISSNFFFEQEIVTNFTSHLKKQVSEYDIQACEDTIVVKIEKSFLENDSHFSAQFQRFCRKVLEVVISSQEGHMAIFKLYSPQERYAYIVQHKPAIISRVPVSQMASYLGVTRETLTRIRRRKAKK